MIERRDPFQAIADPTRREIIQLLAIDPLNVKAVAEHFAISRPAISRHLRILEECGLIRITQQGRERTCHANLEDLREVAQWVGKYRKFWNNRLDTLENLLSKEDEESKKHKTT